MLHHPPLSMDTFNGGSHSIENLLTGIFQSAARVPDLCMVGHIHDYQRLSWQVAGDTTIALATGNGGYHNLHQIVDDFHPVLQLAPRVVCEFAGASQYGFARLTVAEASSAGIHRRQAGHDGGRIRRSGHAQCRHLSGLTADPPALRIDPLSRRVATGPAGARADQRLPAPLPLPAARRRSCRAVGPDQPSRRRSMPLRRYRLGD